MFKARNIITIFVLNYLIILLACSFLEMMFISNKGQEIQQMISVAADMALEQVQSTDDFFVSGGGYTFNSDGTNLQGNNAYKMKVLGLNGEYKDVPLFSTVACSEDIDDIYKYMYGRDDRIKKWIGENPSVLNVEFLAARMPLLNNNTYGLFSEIGSMPKMEYYKVPIVAQLGLDTTGSAAKRARFISGVGSPSSAVVTEIFNTYELNSAKKKAVYNGTNIEYYYTPLNLGLTYINEDLLGALFMNNMELLMRSKYADGDSSYDLNEEEFGNGVLKTAIYSDLVDDSSLNSYNPINNGSFTLLRGDKINTLGSSSVQMYKGMKPKIEYVVIDMYGKNLSSTEKNISNKMLQRIFGAKISKKTDDSVGDAAFRGLTGTGEHAGATVTGDRLYLMDSQTIEQMKNMYPSVQDKHFETKPIIVACVTFYADIIVPYSTPALREMRGRIEDGDDMTGRLLFNPFSKSTTSGNSYLDENYVDLTIESNAEDDLYGEDGRSLNGGSDAFMYTTYFAVTP